MRIGILTGGGDVPGLNACIKTVVRRASELGWDVLGFKRGWAGPLEYCADGPEAQPESFVKLTPVDVRTIDNKGGTILHTSRTDPAHITPESLPAHLKDKLRPPPGADTVDCTAYLKSVLKSLEIDALITLGGDGTLAYSARLHREGVPLISVPKTMDNDIYGTDYCIGFSTAVTRSVHSVTALRTTARSHERIAVIELFGRLSGETALVTGYLADADRVLIAEVPFEMGRVAELIVRDRAANPAHYAIVVVSEGARMTDGEIVVRGSADINGRKRLGGIGERVGRAIQDLTGTGCISQELAYLMRSGTPDSLDRMVATSYGNMAVQLLASDKAGYMTAVQDGNYTAVPADMLTKGKKRVSIEQLYDLQEYRPRIATMAGMPMFLY